MDFLSLGGKLVLVTGSTLGIGKGIAEKFYQQGAHVLINGRSEESVNKTIKEIAEAYPQSQGRLFAAPCDFTSQEGVDKLVRIIDEDIKAPLDVLVNNIGIFEAKPFEEISDEEWLRFFNVNILTGVRLSRTFLPRMLKRDSGSIIFVSSEAALAPKGFMVHYSTTKTAQLGLSRSLAELTKGTKVRVNTVMPGPTWTEGVAEYVKGLAAVQGRDPEALKQNYVRDVEPTSLLQRFLQPEEVANVCVFLASEASSAITGASVRSEGGILRYI
jgi:NAD(P)-dependent dehydrogenase (short-subunit alcohol dehydrogenase family)